MTKNHFQANGVIPACLLPFDKNEEIDESSLRRHLRDLAAITGVTGIAVNGHASEVHACDYGEQQRLTNIALEEVGDNTPIICGIYAERTTEARKLARSAAQAGAHALLVFPPNPLMFGGNARPELAADFIKAIADETPLPIIVFQFQAWTNFQFHIDVLVNLCETVNTIVGIKDLCTNPRLHEQHIQALHSLSRPVNVMTTHSMWLAGSLAMGAKGVISGAGSVIADRQVALFNAVQNTSQLSLTSLTTEMHHLIEALYGDPYVNWQARMKELLYRFGRISAPVTRRPLQQIPKQDWNRMQPHLLAANLTSETIYSKSGHTVADKAESSPNL